MACWFRRDEIGLVIEHRIDLLRRRERLHPDFLRGRNWKALQVSIGQHDHTAAW